MVYSYTASLHGAMAILCLASLIYLFYKKSDSNAEIYKNYFNWFLFFFLYNLALVLPLVMFYELKRESSFFYAAALFFLGLGAWNAFRVGLSLLVQDESRRKIFSIFYVSGVIAAVALHFIFSEVPKGSPDGKWVFWYGNAYVSYIYILFMMTAAWTFTASLLKGYSSLGKVYLKARTLLLMFGGFILSFAAFYYFGATELIHIYLAFLFSILGLMFFLIGNLVGLFKKG
ncbi:MAG: hypothetical protein Q7S12_04170 [bacterium]|nr:hypothetical protein [bacterium]